jgi:hypothetical protein
VVFVDPTGLLPWKFDAGGTSDSVELGGGALLFDADEAARECADTSWAQQAGALRSGNIVGWTWFGVQGLFWEAAEAAIPGTTDELWGVMMGAQVASEMAPLAEGAVAQVAAKAGSLRNASRLNKLATQHETDTGITVLGHYDRATGGYIAKAQRLGASYFDIGDAWDTLTPAQRKAANLRFLNDSIAKGDDILLSTPKGEVRPGSALRTELEHLLSQGYAWVNQWKLKPK